MQNIMDEEEKEQDIWLTPKQVAAMLDVHIRTVRRHLRNGTLKGYRLGKFGDWRIKKSDVEKTANSPSNEEK